MTRKHFEAMADAIRCIPDPAERREQAEALARHCQRANPLFNRVRFLKACGVQS
jgi:hypothetical protein